MQRRWEGKSVNSELLTTRIGDLFKVKDFEAIKGKTSTGYQILAENSPYFKIDGYARVTVEGTPDDFGVSFDLCTDRKKPAFLPSVLLEAMFFGGYFIKRRTESAEDWLKLEREFWRHVENVVLQLTNSAKFSAQE
jgi:hypothetical protein